MIEVNTMRPGNYAHEKWPAISRLIITIKNKQANKYYRLHKVDNIIKTICLTRSQARLYDELVSRTERDEDNNILLLKINPHFKFNFKSLEIMIKRDVFLLADNVLTLV